ncbi:Nucleoporin nup85 [Umbelopsis sp. WA50703]
MASKSNSFMSDDYDKLDMDSDLSMLDSPGTDSHESGSFNWDKITGQHNPKKVEVLLSNENRKDSSSSDNDSVTHPATLSEFYHATFDIFRECQTHFKALGEGSVDDKKKSRKSSSVAKESSQYAKKYSELLSTFLDSQDASKEEISQYRNVWYIWQMCEILFFPDDPAPPVATSLADWLESQGSDFGTTVENALANGPTNTQDIPWDIIKRCAIRGNLPAVNALLENAIDGCTEFSRTLVKDVNKLVEDKPDLPCKSNPAIIASYIRSWRAWDQLVQDRLMSLDPQWGDSDETDLQDMDKAIIRHLRELLEIIIGTHDTILRFGKDWLENLVAITLYAQPNIARNEIPTIMNRVADMDMDNSDELEIYHSFLSFDIDMGLRLCKQEWLTAHLEDLFKHAGLLEDSHEPDEPGIEEYSKAEYAQHLVDTAGDYELAIEYLSYCPINGEHWIKELFQNAHFKSTEIAERLYALCKENGIKGATDSISIALADQLVADKRYADAIDHYLEAGNTHKAEVTAGLILDEYMATGQIEPLGAVRTPDDSYEPNNEYWVLVQYNEFHRLYKCGDYDNASKLLSKLLNSPLTPVKFWPALLLDSLVFLEGEDMYFDEKQTYQMMGCLEELVNTDDRDNHLQSLTKRIKHVKADAKDKDADSIIEMLRFALSRNLARAVSH